MNLKKGFTLVEMLVVMSVLSIAGVLIVTIFTRTLRGGNKAQILGVIKQNGQAVLEEMDKTIRNADNVVCISTDYKSIVIVQNGSYTRFRLIVPSMSENGYILKDLPVKQTDAQTSKEETSAAFIDRICGPGALLSNPVILTDTNSQTGVSANCLAADCANHVFDRDRSAGFMDQVTVKFYLWHGVDASPSVAGQIDPVNFQTTIQLR